MTTIQIRCKAFTGSAVKINKIHVSDDGTVEVWDSAAGHYTRCHALTARSIGKISRLLGENNTLRPLGYCPPDIRKAV